MLILIYISVLLTVVRSACVPADCEISLPVCDPESGECVKCLTTNECEVDKYCYNKECVPYKSDDVYGKFCHIDTCPEDYENYDVCGRCQPGDTEEERTLWTGACIDYVCYPCSVSMDRGIHKEHDDSQCFPATSSGPAGSLNFYSDPRRVYGFFFQNGLSIGLYILVILFIYLIGLSGRKFFLLVVKPRRTKEKLQ